MKTVLWTIAAFCVSAGPAFGDPPGTLSAAKRLLAEIHEEIGHLQTICCGCPFVRTGRPGGDIDREACDLVARKSDKRSDRVEWEHVVSSSWCGRDRACWDEGHPSCTDRNGKPFKGRKCCLVPGVDASFVAAHNDPHNLFPAGGEVNGDRSANPFGNVEGEPRRYGSCNFEVGGEPMVAEPAEQVRGEIARAMLYMAVRYGVDVRMAHAALMSWHLADPPEAWERERARLIEEQTGVGNSYVLSR